MSFNADMSAIIGDLRWLHDEDLFALSWQNVFDATAKPPSGILSGNGNQYGDFDECLSIDAAVRGKYCLASLIINFGDEQKYKKLDYLIHSGHYIRSNITDMGHRVPRYSSLLWGICIPSSCSSFDLEEELSYRLSHLGITAKVHNTMCTVKNVKRPYSFGKALSISFFLAILLLLSLGTILDDDKDGVTNFEKLLNAFSLKRNLRKVFDLSDAATRVKGVDAFRGINALALLVAHKSMAMAHNPYVNKVSFSEVFGMPWAVIGRSAILYTDSFLYLSGFLNAYNLLQELERKGTIDLKSRLINRWFRLFPLFVSLMLFCTYILPDISNGPQWNLVVEEHSRVCEKNMWKSFLFIHNYFGFEEMCLTHTHQIGMDMQLYVATLPLMLLFWKARTIGWTVFASIAVGSTVLRYLAIHWYDISMFVYYGISVQKLLDAARYSYILPTHRATIYLIGVAMAYVIRTKKLNFTLSNSQVRLFWASCFALAAFTIVHPYWMGLEGYQYEHGPAALFAALSPIMWGLFMCMMHWAVCNDYAGSGTAFLESRVFKFFNKIAYSVYLTQFPIFFFTVGVQRHAEYYSPLLLFHIPEMFAIFAISIMTTVAIEMPFNQVYRIYFVLDATAKIPAGILQGNGIQLGDFDQCLSSRARVQLDTGSVVKVQGKYCLVHLDVKAEHPELETPVHLAQAKNLIRGRIDDPGHFVPRFSTLSWGICVPSACDPGDVELVFRDTIKHYQKTSGFAIRVKVEEEDCHVEDPSDLWQRWLEPPVLATLVFYGVIILLVIVGTLQDFLATLPTDEGVDEGNNKGDKERSQTKDGIFTVFSLYRTVSKLTASGTSDEIPCIHGVRAIATIALLVAHKFFPVANMPYTNRSRITDTVSSPMWSWCRAGWMFTDCFLLLSGTLTAHRMSIDTETAAPKRLFSRYIRLTPALLAVVLFYAYIWDNISSGPMWGTFVTKNAEICQQGWWWNLLYVQNYFGLEEMCAPQTHQLALDMQLTILGGIVVWAIQVKKGLSLILLPVLHGVAAYLRYSTVRDHRLTLLAYHGVSVSQLYRTARLSYTSTLHRSTAYLIGITLGMALTKPTRHGKIILTLGWLTSGMLWALVWWAGIDSGSTSYRYSASFAAQYAGLAPIASAMAIAWLIYAVNNGNYGLLSQFLCCRPLAIISRLSYALYLCQFIIFMTNLGIVRNSSEFTLMSLVDLQEIAAILISSIILTLTLVIPMQSFHKLLKFSFKFENNLQNGPKTEKNETNSKELYSKSKEEREIKQKPRAHFLAHREVLEEIPEEEVEYEMHRHKNEELDEIVEEEENEELGEVDQHHFDEELDVIEEEQGGEEAWVEREYDERPYSREDNELDEWEWTANNEDGAQFFRNIR